MAATNDPHEDHLKGSDSDDIQYKPRILKTFKVGIDRITSLAAVNARYGFYTAVCNNNSKELTFCDKDGEIIVRNLILHSIYDVRDLGSFGSMLIAANGDSIIVKTFEKCQNPSESSAKSPISKTARNMLSTGCVTGIYSLHNDNAIVVCHATGQSYEPTLGSRRYVAVYTTKIYDSTNYENMFFINYIYKSTPSLIIEYKHSVHSVNTSESNKECLFTYPKRVTESDIGDLWIVDRKSPNRGDIKVCDIKGNLKFIYNGGPIVSKFDPTDISVNQKDVLVIADCSNHKIHLVRNDGMFFQYLMTEQQGLQLPTAICVDVFQRAWVGCDEGTVHIIRYFPKFE